MNLTEPTRSVRVDRTLDEAVPADYDALLVPGGFIGPDFLRQSHLARELVRDFDISNKPIASLCHGPWLLVEANVLRSRRVTSWPSLRTDIRNAGGEWVDEEVVADGKLVTSRKPADIPAFNRKMIEEFAEGVHEAQPRVRTAGVPG